MEVDFVVYTQQTFMAVEVKNATRVQPSDVAGLRAFVEDYPGATPVLVYRGTERIMFNGVLLVPAGAVALIWKCQCRGKVPALKELEEGT